MEATSETRSIAFLGGVLGCSGGIARSMADTLSAVRPELLLAQISSWARRKGRRSKAPKPTQAVARQLRIWLARQTHQLSAGGEPPLWARRFTVEQLVSHAKVRAVDRVCSLNGGKGVPNAHSAQ